MTKSVSKHFDLPLRFADSEKRSPGLKSVEDSSLSVELHVHTYQFAWKPYGVNDSEYILSRKNKRKKPIENIASLLIRVYIKL